MPDMASHHMPTSLGGNRNRPHETPRRDMGRERIPSTKILGRKNVSPLSSLYLLEMISNVIPG